MTNVPVQQPARFGNYILLDRINVGGMAEVFRGKSSGVEGFERMVALKRILPGIAADPDFIEMFIDEAKLTVQFQHANIAQTYDLGKSDGMYYIAMEYISGADLRTMWDRARSRKRLLPIAMSCYILQRCCEGLDAAHRKKDASGKDLGLVHRDVSPQNILVSFEGEVKVIDFGIAKAKTRISKTQAGMLKGKFGYMSPEQVRGIELDNRSDIFACGTILYELVVGERLFLAESEFLTLERVRNVDLVPPSQINSNLSLDLERIIMRALSKDRDDRYRWSSEMAEDLQRYLFASNQPFARTDLQRYMQQHFKEEIAAEAERLDRYREISFSDAASDAGVRGSTPSPSLGPSPSPSPREVTKEQASVAMESPPQTARNRPVTVMTRVGESALQSGSLSRVVQSVLPAWAMGLIAGLIAAVLAASSVALYLAKRERPSGSITIEVIPGDSEIYVGERLVSNASPFTIDNLEPETYVISIKRDGFRSILRAVNLAEGEARMESFRLDREDR